MMLWTLVIDCEVPYEAAWQETIGIYSSYENAAKAMQDLVTYKKLKQQDLWIVERNLDEGWEVY